MNTHQSNHFKELELERVTTASNLNRLQEKELTDPVLRQQWHYMEAKLDRIEKALVKLHNSDDYGSCQQCRRPIHSERLELLPYAETCISCQRQLEKKTLGQRRYH
jgi:DnaK suppressor protein